jgi:hypothetical protein
MIRHVELMPAAKPPAARSSGASVCETRAEGNALAGGDEKK